MKNKNDFSGVIAQACKDYHQNNKDFQNPYYATSPNGDAYFLAYWALYWGHTTKDRLKEFTLAPSRGYLWKVKGDLVRITNASDYRNGANFIKFPQPLETSPHVKTK